MDINKIRLAVLQEDYVLLAMKAPTKDTFSDSYSECLRRLKCVANSLEEDIEKGE
jgi:hypothetical protein